MAKTKTDLDDTPKKDALVAVGGEMPKVTVAELIEVYNYRDKEGIYKLLETALATALGD